MLKRQPLFDDHQKCQSELLGIQNVLETAGQELTVDEAAEIFDFLEYAKNHINRSMDLIRDSEILNDKWEEI